MVLPILSEGGKPDYYLSSAKGALQQVMISDGATIQSDYYDFEQS